MNRVPHCNNCEFYKEYNFGFSLSARKTLIVNRCAKEKERDILSKEFKTSPKWCPLRIK